MEDLKILFWGNLAWALFFFLWPLIETRSIKEAFWEWKNSMREWLDVSLPATICYIIIALLIIVLFLFVIFR